MINSIHHIAIICSDYKVSKHFYSEVLGFKIIAENYRADKNSWKLDLQINDQTSIELFSFVNSPKRLSYPEAVGLRHFSFSVEDLEEVMKKLKLKGIVFEKTRIDEYTGKKFVFFEDPDGLPIELYEK